MIRTLIILFISCCLLASCHRDSSWNNPHQLDEVAQNIYFGSFIGPPKTLDPLLSYSADEAIFIAQIYEPPLQYHYLKRPYSLIPATAAAMPTVRYWDKNHHELSANAPAAAVAFSTYDIKIKPDIYYQPHPAFAKNAKGEYRYLDLDHRALNKIRQLSDFPEMGTRELTAEDYVYEIKRLAHPALNSPVYGVMNKYIVGLIDFRQTLQKAYAQQPPDIFFDLRQYNFPGAEVVDRYTYRITIKGKYPQFIYWLAMPFFAPIPWEADKFYSQSGMGKKNLSLSWHPVGTGPFYLSENNPNRRMVLERNPNFHSEYYPSEGEIGDQEKGYLNNAGKRLPLIDKFVFTLEKESIPRWNKFLQGYYDASSISSDSFDQAIAVDESGQPQLTPLLKDKGIRLQTSIKPSTYYFGFNMQDNIVGGESERAQKLRQALSIALNIEQFINIFLNGRGFPAQGPIPPGIFGYLSGPEGINSIVYTWQDDAPKRKPIADAKRLLAEAGYPNGRDPKTGAPLLLNYDAIGGTAADDKARFDWMRSQFAQLGIELNIRSTEYNRFQERVRTGAAQIFFWGWEADYPDPENFLFLLYGPNGKMKFGGENATNYENPNFDRLFEKMKVTPNGPERQALINQMVAIARIDAPWIWGLHLKEFTLLQPWVGPVKPGAIGNNVLKYYSVDPQLRAAKQKEWNRPNPWPLIGIGFIFIILILAFIVHYWRRRQVPRVKKIK